MSKKENEEFNIDLDNTGINLAPVDSNEEDIKKLFNDTKNLEDKIEKSKEMNEHRSKGKENEEANNAIVDKKRSEERNPKKAIPFIAHILGFIFITMMVFGVLELPNVQVKEFYNSKAFNDIFMQYENHVMDYITNSKNGYYEEVEKKQSEYEAKLAEIEAKYEEEINNKNVEIENTINTIREGNVWKVMNTFFEKFGISYDQWMNMSNPEKEYYLDEYKTNYLEEDYQYTLEEVKESELSKLQNEYDIWDYDYRAEAKGYALDMYKNLKFYAIDKTNGTIYTNIENLNSENFSEEYLKNNSQFLFSIKGNSETGISEVGSPLNKEVFDWYYNLHFNADEYKDFDVYYMVPSVIRLQDEIYRIIKSYETQVNANIIYGVLVSGAIGTAIYLIYLLIRRKRLFNEGMLDRFYRWLCTEIKCGLNIGGIGLIIVCFGGIMNTYFGGYGYYYDYYERLLLVALCILGLIGVTLIMLLFNMKYIKNSENVFKDVFKRSVLFTCAKWLYRGTINIVKIVPIKCKRAIELSYFQENKVYMYWIALCVGALTVGAGLILTLLCMLDYGFALLILPASIILGGGICYFVIYYMDSLQQVVKATDDICNGDFNVNVEEKGDFVTKKLAHNINNINNGLKVAVDNEIRSERMKGELITNVSHDLKTPLTSIINYVDLLKDDRATEAEKKKYIEILERKSQRLKVLIEDLFEVSKATSGTMELNVEEVEVSALLRQAFGELKEKIDNSSISFRTKFAENKVYSRLDGNKTWRVFENLLVNILKYSLPGSRAYIELNDLGEQVQIVMKNTSQEELEFTSDEIVERFKRGDASRNTEGSGLGLAISKSIVELQGGTFNVDIDGDLFKVTITFDKLEK